MTPRTRTGDRIVRPLGFAAMFAAGAIAGAAAFAFLRDEPTPKVAQDERTPFDHALVSAPPDDNAPDDGKTPLAEPKATDQPAVHASSETAIAELQAEVEALRPLAEKWREHEKSQAELAEERRLAGAEAAAEAREADQRRADAAEALGDDFAEMLNIRRTHGLRSGHFPSDANNFRVMDGANLDAETKLNDEESRVVTGKVRETLIADGSYKAIVFKETPSDSARIETKTYTTLHFAQDLRGEVRVDSYTSIIVMGAMEGTIICNSYTEIYLNGPVRGAIKNLYYDKLVLGPDATVESSASIEALAFKPARSGVVKARIVVNGLAHSASLLDRISVPVDETKWQVVTKLREQNSDADVSDMYRAVEVIFKQCELPPGEYNHREHVRVVVEKPHD